MTKWSQPRRVSTGEPLAKLKQENFQTKSCQAQEEVILKGYRFKKKKTMYIFHKEGDDASLYFTLKKILSQYLSQIKVIQN